MSSDYDGKEETGKVVAGEFVGADDEDGRPPGTYVTIRLDNISAALVCGPVKITYLALENER